MIATETTGKASSAQVGPLPDEHKDEALAFLGARPVHTVIMAGLMREHGTDVSRPPGTFYGYRNEAGQLEGVALIGCATMFEARTSAALAAFAREARAWPSVHMIMGEASELQQFLSHYALDLLQPRRCCRELFYQFTRKDETGTACAGLQPAALDQLDEIVAAHAAMVMAETGVNPLDTDLAGFRQRCAARVARGHVWTLIEQGELIFKVDVVAETPQAAYLEGVWVNPKYRQAGYARRCWTQLGRLLLDKWPAFCGFVNVENLAGRSFYERMGGTLLGCYDKVYL